MDKKVLPLKHSVKGKVISVGIDVHRLSWQIAALTDGEVIMAVTISLHIDSEEAGLLLTLPYRNDAMHLI
jgi:hypothetical protein